MKPQSKPDSIFAAQAKVLARKFMREEGMTDPHTFVNLWRGIALHLGLAKSEERRKLRVGQKEMFK